MSNSSEEVCVDELFVGLTRPATVAGIPYAAFVVELMATTMIFLAVGNPLYFLIMVPMHGILYLVSADDPGAFASMYVWLQTIGLCRNTRFWGAASFSPLRMVKWKK
jgi:type IV secretion system protein VirB3